MPPYGDGIIDDDIIEDILWLSPPYGDGIKITFLEPVLGTFSPPCGDGTEEDMTPDEFAEFSPPYGDCTLRLPDQGLLQGVFAPLRGWYQVGYAEPDLQCVFAPLRGWYFREGYQRADPSCFRPLAGIVPP